jgi:adenylate kinase family enzyme
VYQAQTAPLLDYYSERGLLRQIHASGTEEAVAEHVRAALSDLVQEDP